MNSSPFSFERLFPKSHPRLEDVVFSRLIACDFQ